MKWRRRSAVHTRPRTTPDSATSSISSQPASSACPSIQAPGMVKASPPATMAPALMTVCVTFASLRLALPWPSALRKNSEMMAANTMGQGSAPILRAVYTDAAVMMAQPTQPMRMPRSVSCPLTESMSFSFAYIRFPSHREVGLPTGRVQYNRAKRSKTSLIPRDCGSGRAGSPREGEGGEHGEARFA